VSILDHKTEEERFGDGWRDALSLCEECGGEFPAGELSPDAACEDCERDLQEEANAYGPDYFDDPRFTGEPGFADPGGNSALRAATACNPRNLPCPNCGQPNRLTPADRARGYQCDACADRAERGGW